MKQQEKVYLTDFYESEALGIYCKEKSA